MNTANRLIANRLAAVIRTRSAEQALQVARAAVEGGIRTVEITLTVPRAGEILARLRKEFRKETDILVGAGTVLTPDDARRCFDAGAQFLVAPTTNPKIAALARRRKVPYVAGVLTPNEVFAARDLGADFIKIFPMWLVGPRYLRTLLQLDPTLRFMPSGGIDRGDIRTLFEAGARVVCLGNELFEGYYSGEDSYDGLVRRIRASVEIAAPRSSSREPRKP